MAAKSRQNTHPLETGTPNPPGGPARMDGQPKPLSPDASTAVAIASPALDLQQRLGEQLSAFHAHPEVTAPGAIRALVYTANTRLRHRQ